MNKHSDSCTGFEAQSAAYTAADCLSEPAFHKYALRTLKIWSFIGALILVFVAAYALEKISIALQILVISFVISFLVSPFVSFLEKKGVNRGLGTLFAYIIAMIVLGLLLALVLPVLVTQIKDLLASIPLSVYEMQNYFENLYSKYGEYLANTQVRTYADRVFAIVSSKAWAFANSSASGLISFGGSLASMIAMIGMSLVVAFWLTMDFPKFRKEALAIVGPDRAQDFEIMAAVFARAMGGYIKGLVITSACTGCIAGLGFFFLGVPYAGLLGIATAILNVIPFVGPWIGGAIAAVVSMFVSPTTALLSVVVTIVAQQITDTLISPKVMQSAVAVHPALVILGLTAAGAVGGVVGMIFVVPLLAALKGVFIYYFEKRAERQLVSMEGALFRGQPFNDAEGKPIPALDATGGTHDGFDSLSQAPEVQKIAVDEQQDDNHKDKEVL